MSVTDMIEQQLDPGTIQQIGQRIGADPNQTSQAISAAIPMLMAAMAKNTAELRLVQLFPKVEHPQRLERGFIRFFHHRRERWLDWIRAGAQQATRMLAVLDGPS